MKLRRFFSVTPLLKIGQTVFLDESETHHMRDILRLKSGEKCLLVDGLGREGEAVITQLRPNEIAAVTIENFSEKKSHSSILIHAFVAIPQRGKMDFIIEKAQELGVEFLTPLETEHTIVKMTAENKIKTTQRWNKIAIEAAKQSGCSTRLQIQEPKTLRAVFNQLPGDSLSVVFHPSESAELFGAWMQDLKSKNLAKYRVNIFIGPEGGFSDQEVKFMIDQKAKQLTLGETLLKVDTAFLGVAASLKFLFQ
jgi:16S rRNA (uracil1498-N3)-methyltransferase